MANEHAAHLSTGTKLGLAATGAAAGVTLAPYALPALGIGSAALRDEVITGLHGTDLGTGIAGGVNGLLSHVPLVGDSLAAGGFASIAGTALFGIGGIFLARWLEKREQENPNAPKWSKTVRTIALATSILIALPAIMTGLSIGLTFLASALGGTAVGSSVMTAMATSLGSAGAVHLGSGLSGLAVSALPHLLTCGAVLAPLAFGMFMGKSPEPAARPAPVINGPLQLQGRLQAPQPAMAHAH